MAKFCTNCGKPLDESGICSCEKEKKEVSLNTKTFKEYINKIMDIAKGLVKTPADTAKKYVSEKNFIEGSIMIVLASIILSLFVLACAKQILSMSIFNMGIYGNDFNDILGSTSVVQIPYFQIFLKVCIGALIMFFGTAFIFHIVNTQLFKAKGSFKGMISLVGTASLYYSVLGACSVVFAFLSIPIAIFVFSISAMLYSYYLYSGLKHVTNTKENNYAYMIVASYIIGSIIIFLLTKVFG